MKHQDKDGNHQVFGNTHEGTTSTNDDEEKVKSQYAPPYKVTKFGEQKRKCGHYPRNRSKNRGSFPTFVVNYEENELRDLLVSEIPRNKKDSLVHCFNYHNPGHYANECLVEKSLDYQCEECLAGKCLNLVTCFKCENKGHYANNCPEKLHQDS